MAAAQPARSAESNHPPDAQARDGERSRANLVKHPVAYPEDEADQKGYPRGVSCADLEAGLGLEQLVSDRVREHG